MISNLGEDLKRFIEDAEKSGKEKGLEQGLEQGKKVKAIEVAKQLLSKGMSLEDVSEITKLSIEYIKKINSEQR